MKFFKLQDPVGLVTFVSVVFLAFFFSPPLCLDFPTSPLRFEVESRVLGEPLASRNLKILSFVK